MRLSNIILLAVLGSAGIVTVHSQEPTVPRLLQVVETPDLKDEPPPDPIGERASRVARVEIDVAQLYRGPSKRIESSVAPIPGLTLDVEVFPGEIYRLQGVRATQSGGVWSWTAKVADDEIGHAVLTIDRGAVFGTLQVTGHHFTIITDHSGRQWVREDDPKQALDDIAIGTPTKDSGDLLFVGGPAAPEGGSSTTLDVLILYTAAASASYPMFSVVPNGAASADQSFSDSGVTGNVSIVGYQASTYTEDDPMGPTEQVTVLAAMQAGTGDFTGLSTLRDNLNADVVMLVYDSSFATTVCGSAYALQDPAGASTYAVVVIGDGCMGSWRQFTHEIGHVMGGKHDHPTGDSNICFAATGNSMMHGYTRTSAPIFRTIMGSSASCDFSSCDRLTRWSDPDSTYSGYAIGVANQSNMVDVLGTSLCVGGGSLSLVADYQAPAGSAPGQPGTLTVTNMVCYGFNELTWGTSSGNVGWYEVETSASSNYSSPSVVIRGSEYTELVIDVPGTRYVRVKACNGNGCSSWRNGNSTATYYSGCA